MDKSLRACHDAVKDNEAKSLSAKMGVPHVSLLEIFTARGAGTHRMNLDMLGQGLTHLSKEGRLAVLGALANQFECDVVTRKRPEPKPLMSALCHLTAECGDVGRLIFDATADNHISQHEKAQGDKAIQEAIDALHILRESLKAA